MFGSVLGLTSTLYSKYSSTSFNVLSRFSLRHGIELLLKRIGNLCLQLGNYLWVVELFITAKYTRIILVVITVTIVPEVIGRGVSEGTLVGSGARAKEVGKILQIHTALILSVSSFKPSNPRPGTAVVWIITERSCN